jgi:hypothetical protein
MLLSFLSILLHLFHTSENTTDLLGVPGPLQFNKTEFHLALSGKPEKNMTMHMYLPKGENLDNYNQKLSLLVINTKKDVDGVIKAKMKELTARQKLDFNCKFSTNELADGKEMLVEYIQSETNGKSLSEAEYSVSRVKWLTESEDGNYIMILTYSWRTYEEEAVDMIKNLNTYKTEFIQEMSKKELPEIKIGK